MGQPVYKYDLIAYQMPESFRNMDPWSLTGQRTGRKMNSFKPMTTSGKKNSKYILYSGRLRTLAYLGSSFLLTKVQRETNALRAYFLS